MYFNKKIPVESVSGQNIDGYSTSGSFSSNPIAIHGVYGYSLGFIWPATGSPVGTVKVQHSVDFELDAQMIPDGNVVNWTDVPSATISVIAGGGNGIIEVFSASRWMRLVYTAGSGSIIATARFHAKSMS